MATTTKAPTECGCGCGADAKRRFLPGHDARLKSTLLKSYRSATSDAARAKVLKQAEALGWAHFMTDAPAKVNGTKPKTAKAAKGTGAKAGFHPVRVKIGRWVYDAIVLEDRGDELTVRYEPKGKQPVTRDVPKTSLVDD